MRRCVDASSPFLALLLLLLLLLSSSTAHAQFVEYPSRVDCAPDGKVELCEDRGCVYDEVRRRLLFFMEKTF